MTRTERRIMRRLPALVVGLAVVGALLGMFSPGDRVSAEAVGVSNHLIVIPMENKNYTQIVGNVNAPYINNTMIPGGRLFTNFYAVTHPSLPDYLVLSGGDYRGCVTDACAPNSIPGENIFHQLGGNWKVYAENMPSNCYRANKAPYLVRHNPAVYYTNLDAAGGDGTCQTRDVPYGQLATDITANTIPSLAWIIPNYFNDMHNNKNAAPCLTGDAVQNEVCQGDLWLSQKLPGILSNGGRDDVTVLLVFDEASSGQNQGGGGKVAVIEMGAGVTPGTVDNAPYSHYGLYNAMADRLGVPRLFPAVPSL
jgi:phosphatidylinositol-3-phosphatase